MKNPEFKDVDVDKLSDEDNLMSEAEWEELEDDEDEEEFDNFEEIMRQLSDEIHEKFITDKTLSKEEFFYEVMDILQEIIDSE